MTTTSSKALLATPPRASAPARAPQRERLDSTRLRRPFLGLLGVAIFVLVWQVATSVLALDPNLLPGPVVVLAKVVDLLARPALWTDLRITMTAWAIGVGTAVVAAVGLGLLLGSNTFLRRATRSTIEFIRPIPSVALIPVVVLLFGFEITSTVVLVIKAALWPTLIQTMYGVVDVDPVASETARSYRFGPFARARYVVLPTALPYMLTGIRLSCAIGLILAITAELVIPAPGLGSQIGLAEASGASDQLYALIVITGAIGVLLNVGVRQVEKRVLHWHASVRRDVPL